ncbi:MAG: hypothetical protein ACRDZQ_12895, partial [Acidimicrobiales bacterium]
MAGALALLALSLSACGTTAPPSAPSASASALAAARTPVPSTFVASRSSRNGATTRVELVSSDSGRVVRVLATAGPSFTDNGLARSPDGRYVYATWIGPSSLLVERIPAAGGAPVVVAGGEEPAPSPNGRFLADVTGPGGQVVAVRDLASGRTRRWDLGPVMGPGRSLLAGYLTWVADGSELVAMPQPDPVAAGTANSATTDGPPGAANTATTAAAGPAGVQPACGTVSSSTQCLVAFDPSSPRPVIHTEVVPLPGVDVTGLFSGGTAAPRAVLVVGAVRGGDDVIERVQVGQPGTTAVRVARGPIMALAVDPSGTRLLYLVGSSPPVLWRGTLRSGRLVDTRR